MVRRVVARFVTLGFLVAALPSIASAQNAAPMRPQPAPPRAAPPQGPAAAPQPATQPGGVRPAQVYGPPRSGAGAPMPPAGQPGAIAPPTQPMAPFVLTAQEDAEVQKALLAWERACSGLNDVKCAFHRKDVNPTFGTETHYDGEIKYKKPDKARYYAKSEAVAGQAQEQEQYFCDGLSLYEWNYKNKQLIQHILPEDMRGAAIADGPLPFLFTATAEKLRNRYFLRLVTPANEKASVWIEAYPRHQQDAATFSKATVILDLKTMLPSAVEMYEPDRITRRVHTFGQFRTNDPLNWLKDPMAKPLPQLGWKFVVDDPQAEAAARAAKEGPMRK